MITLQRQRQRQLAGRLHPEHGLVRARAVRRGVRLARAISSNNTVAFHRRRLSTTTPRPAPSRIHTPFSGFGPPGFPALLVPQRRYRRCEGQSRLRQRGLGRSPSALDHRRWHPRTPTSRRTTRFGRLNPDRGRRLPAALQPGESAHRIQRVPTMTRCPTIARPSPTSSRPIVMVYAQFSTGHKGGGICAAALQLLPDSPLRAGEARLLRARFQDGLVRSQGARERLRLPRWTTSGYQGIPNVCVGNGWPAAARERAAARRASCGQYLNLADAQGEGLRARNHAAPGEWPQHRWRPQLRRLQVRRAQLSDQRCACRIEPPGYRQVEVERGRAIHLSRSAMWYADASR